MQVSALQESAMQVCRADRDCAARGPDAVVDRARMAGKPAIASTSTGPENGENRLLPCSESGQSPVLSPPRAAALAPFRHDGVSPWHHGNIAPRRTFLVAQ